MKGREGLRFGMGGYFGGFGIAGWMDLCMCVCVWIEEGLIWGYENEDFFWGWIFLGWIFGWYR